MEFIEKLITADNWVMLIPVSLIIAVFGYLALRAHYRHIERLERIKQGLDPDY